MCDTLKMVGVEQKGQKLGFGGKYLIYTLYSVLWTARCLK